VDHDGSAFRPFDPARARALRRTGGFSAIDLRDQTASTNADAAARLGERDANGVTIFADYQQAGAGRKGRRWIAAPQTALLFTTILREPLDVGSLWAVPFWTALAVADAIEAAAGVRVALKWPNDLLLGDAKCCGILCVSRVAGDRAYVGCGVGIDVIRPGEPHVVAGIEPPPAFLRDVAPALEREALFAAILDRFDADESALHQPDAIARRWETRAALDGTPYHVYLDADGLQRRGIARRLGPAGELMLDIDGAETAIDLADARVVRASA